MVVTPEMVEHAQLKGCCSRVFVNENTKVSIALSLPLPVPRQNE
ncbi:hypothetical protein HMPREF3198_01109 [Winkia neuii]|nr:hypothetical protein HMPREF3198_01109 [Winkia neuii]